MNNEHLNAIYVHYNEGTMNGGYRLLYEIQRISELLTYGTI